MKARRVPPIVTESGITLKALPPLTLETVTTYISNSNELRYKKKPRPCIGKDERLPLNPKGRFHVRPNVED